MFFQVDKDSVVAVYEQINFAVKAAIASGRVSSGEQLPSIREVAAQLDVNPNTVAKAFRDLETQGYVFTRRGMGVFVANDIRERCQQECMDRVATVVSVAKHMCLLAGINWNDLSSSA